MRALCLRISIVSYAPDLLMLRRTVEAAQQSAEAAQASGHLASAALVIVDNGPGTTWTSQLETLSAGWPRHVGPSVVLTGHGNVGYGRGHNLAIVSSEAEWHLILNPDAVLDREALRVLLERVGDDPTVAVATPRIDDDSGQQLYLCRRYPSVFDLWLRGFAPAAIRRRFRVRLDRYELRDLIGPTERTDVPILSGCLMLARTSALQAVGGFSDAFFMYFEDYDLSLRLRPQGQTLYVPHARATHSGGHAARKGWRHILWFTRSAATFFGRHGWKLW